jgi:hypothetical protein
MATTVPNQFTQYNLADAESLAGQTLSINQLMVLQNLRAEYALKKIALVYTPDAHQQYLQQEAEITGWLNCLNYIMDSNEAAREAIVTAANSGNNES